MAATTATRKTTTKTCYIVRRYEIKRNGTVCCVVRNEQGVDYTTCLHANGLTSCTCKAQVSHCYHVKHVLAAETARQEQVAQAAVIAPLLLVPSFASDLPAHDELTSGRLTREEYCRVFDIYSDAA